MYSVFARPPAIVSTYFTFEPCTSKCFVYSVPLTKNSTMSLSETAECGRYRMRRKPVRRLLEAELLVAFCFDYSACSAPGYRRLSGAVEDLAGVVGLVP